MACLFPGLVQSIFSIMGKISLKKQTKKQKNQAEILGKP